MQFLKRKQNIYWIINIDQMGYITRCTMYMADGESDLLKMYLSLHKGSRWAWNILDIVAQTKF